MIDDPNKLTEQGIEEVEKKFDEFLLNPEDKEIFLETISEKVQVDAKTQFEDLASYQRWYTFLVWPKLGGYKSDECIKIFSNHFHVALLLGNDVWLDLLMFLTSPVYDLVERVELYEKIRQLLKNSKVIVARMGNKDYIFSDILEICKDRIKNEGDTEGLKILLKPVIFCPEIEKLDKYYVFDRDKILQNYIKFIKNILTVEKEGILKELDRQFHPEFAEMLKTVDEYRILLEEKNTKKETEKSKTNKIMEKTETKIMNTPTYAEIKDKILQFFPKDEAGDILDTEGVFEVLEKTADKYSDPKIKELYYYNEATGKFEWGV